LAESCPGAPQLRLNMMGRGGGVKPTAAPGAPSRVQSAQVASSPAISRNMKIRRCGTALSHTTIRSSGAPESGSAPRPVTIEVRPSVIARPASLSIRIMCRKNTMPGATTVGLSR
jgi:hypothetical protein